MSDDWPPERMARIHELQQTPGIKAVVAEAPPWPEDAKAFLLAIGYPLRAVREQQREAS